MATGPEMSEDQRIALEMLAEHGGEWTRSSGWHVGSASKTVRLFESLE
jgi:hypothetical protein